MLPGSCTHLEGCGACHTCSVRHHLHKSALLIRNVLKVSAEAEWGVGSGARTERMVNPVAWGQGLVMAKCGGCESWHKLRDEGNLVDVSPTPPPSPPYGGFPALALALAQPACVVTPKTVRGCCADASAHCICSTDSVHGVVRR